MSVLATVPKNEKTVTEDGEIQQGYNKYIHHEFAGWIGERYVKKLLRQILPMALYRTWEIFVEHQANGNDCYLGVPQLAAIAGRTSRTMQKNLAELGAKQLMVERVKRKVLSGRDGSVTSRVVVVKDFSRLYALAHEYHEWLSAANYVAPDRAVIELIAQDEHLVAKVRRFDNYRRVLYNQHPGPPPPIREEDRWFTEYQADGVAPGDAPKHAKEADQQKTDQRAKIHLPKEVSKAMTKDSPKRITVLPSSNHGKGDSCDSDFSLSEQLWKGATEMPAKSGGQQAEAEMPAKSGGQQAESEPDQTTYTWEARQSVPNNTSRNLSPSSPSAQETQHIGQTFKQEQVEAHLEECQSPQVTGAMGMRTTGHAVRSRGNDPRSSSPEHPLAGSFVQAISAPCGDLNTKGSLTRVLGIIAQAHLDQPAEVLPCLVRAYIVARDTHTIRPEHWDATTGRANRMPLFCTMFERFIQARVQERRWDYTWQQMEEDIEADDRLTLWRNEHQAVFHEMNDGQAHDKKREQHVQGTVPFESTRKEVEQRVSAVFLQQRRHPRLSQTEEERAARATYARTVMARVSRMAVAMNEPIIWGEHLACGCSLYHKQAGKAVCALCFPDPAWPEEVRALIHSIVAARTSGGISKGATGAGDKKVSQTEERPPEGRSNPRHVPATSRWTEREEAYVCGVRVLEALASSGYTAEMMVRPLEEWYQVVLVDEDCELVLETAEHVQCIIEQAHATALKARRRHLVHTGK